MRFFFGLFALVCSTMVAAPAPRPRADKSLADCYARCTAGVPKELTGDSMLAHDKCLVACERSKVGTDCFKSKCCVYATEKNGNFVPHTDSKPEFTWVAYNGCEKNDETTTCPIIDGNGLSLGRPMKSFEQVYGLCDHADDEKGKCRFGSIHYKTDWFHRSACVNAANFSETIELECTVKCTTGGPDLSTDGEPTWKSIRTLREKKVSFPESECRRFVKGEPYRVTQTFLDSLYCKLCPNGTDNVIVEHCNFYHRPIKRGEK